MNHKMWLINSNFRNNQREKNLKLTFGYKTVTKEMDFEYWDQEGFKWYEFERMKRAESFTGRVLSIPVLVAIYIIFWDVKV